MTACKFKLKPTWHQTGADCQGRAICVAESPHNLLLRLKGTRQILRLPWGVALVKAAMLEASAARLRRINERKAKAKAKNRRKGA
jgi:hypothetical protein